MGVVQVPAAGNRAPGSESERAPFDPSSPRSDPWFGWQASWLAFSPAGELILVAP